MRHNPKIEAAAEPDWRDLTAIARKDVESTVAMACIVRLRDEALEMAAHRYAGWRISIAVAQACDYFIDCPCISCLDEIDCMMADEPVTRADEIEADREWLADMSREYAGGLFA